MNKLEAVGKTISAIGKIITLLCLLGVVVFIIYLLI